MVRPNEMCSKKCEKQNEIHTSHYQSSEHWLIRFLFREFQCAQQVSFVGHFVASRQHNHLGHSRMESYFKSSECIPFNVHIGSWMVSEMCMTICKWFASIFLFSLALSSDDRTAHSQSEFEYFLTGHINVRAHTFIFLLLLLQMSWWQPVRIKVR